MTTAAIQAGPMHVTPGHGVLVRASGALLFVAAADDRASSLVTAFLDAADTAPVDAAVDAVTEAATARRFDVPPFVLVGWAGPAAGLLHVVALGPIEVRTDHPSLPMLSGAGSGSWVERRLRLDAEATVVVEVGPAADAASDLQLGRVAADGFTATFRATERPATERPVTGERPAEPAVRPAVHGSMGATSEVDGSAQEAPTAAPEADTASAPPAPAADPTGPIGGDRLAALRAAMGAGESPTAAPPTAPAPPTTAPATPTEAVVDDEITLAPDDPPPAPEPHPSAAAAPQPSDDESAPFVVAVRCPRGHVNPTHVSVCRTCGDLLDTGAVPETIRQPPLALLDAGGDTVPVDRTLVVGRRPDADAAQAPERARLVVIEGDGSVSRTHLRVDVEDWSLTVTDCGSRSGTAIVTRPGEEPRILESWVSYELPVGARLFLGGPSSVVIRPVDAGRGRRD